MLFGFNMIIMSFFASLLAHYLYLGNTGSCSPINITEPRSPSPGLLLLRGEERGIKPLYIMP